MLFLVMGYAGLVFNVPALAINTVVIVSVLMYKKNHDFRNLAVSYVFGLLLSTVLFFFVFKCDPVFFYTQYFAVPSVIFVNTRNSIYPIFLT